ncbi:MAG TPA: metallophosphoesterase [Kofleriaceae bacterium]|nr:metallophosphoesterase [Kofleriaceae bacterium]
MIAACDDEPDTVDVDSEVAASATLLISGDFAEASTTKSIVAQEIATNPSVQLLPVGDLSYTSPYDPGYPWINWLARTYPVIGNHEINCPHAGDVCGSEAFALFDGNNAAANHHFPAITGDNGKPTYDFAYSHEVAPGWLLVVLNTGTDCKQQSCAQQATRMTSWITSWRSAHGGHGCVIVAMHTARWSTRFSSSGDNLPWATSVAPIWTAAIANHVDLIVQGHVHAYEEFERLDASGHASPTGVKLFTLGAGGRGQVTPNLSNIDASLRIGKPLLKVNGVLELALYPGSYGYRFEQAATSGTPASSTACNEP